jgi:TPR repeat protein
MNIPTLNQKASNGDANAQYELGDLYRYGGYDEFGAKVRTNQKQAVAWYQKSAEQGHREAQSALASMYQYGHGVRRNIKLAFYWYKKSADQGYDSAQASLADLYRWGEGVAEDSEQAMLLYRKAADQGAKEYQRKLADVMVDDAPNEAAHWYRLAAESNDAEAQFKLAELYEQGNGVPKNDEEAFSWYLKAEQLEINEEAFCGGFNKARYEVARCYVTGKGVRKDSEEALKRLLPFADPKLTERLWSMPGAQLLVATVFADPEHARHDLIEAYVWINLAASYVPKGRQLFSDVSGESLAQWRDTLGARLSHAQLQLAQQRSMGLFVSTEVIEERLRIR